MGRQVFGTRMVYWETFSQIQRCPLQHLICRNSIHGVPVPKSRKYGATRYMWWTSKFQTQSWIRDFRLDRQPGIHSTPRREDSGRIMEQTNKDCRFRNFMLEDSSTAWKNEKQTPVQDQRCQSGPSAQNSVISSEGDSSKNYGADQQRLQISDLHFDIRHNNICLWKIRLKIEVRTCTQFPTEAMLWNNEVEMVESVDDLNSSRKDLMVQTLSCSMRELLQHWTKSSRIPASRKRSVCRKWKLTKPLLRRKTDCLLDLRILPGHWVQRFCRELCRPIYSRSSKWQYSGIRFEMGWNSFVDDTNPIWWHLRNFVQIKNTRVWETQDRFGHVQCGDSSEESRTWLSQIEDDVKKRYRAEFVNEELWSQKWKIWNKRRDQESGDNSVNKEV